MQVALGFFSTLGLFNEMIDYIYENEIFGHLQKQVLFVF